MHNGYGRMRTAGNCSGPSTQLVGEAREAGINAGRTMVGSGIRSSVPSGSRLAAGGLPEGRAGALPGVSLRPTGARCSLHLRLTWLEPSPLLPAPARVYTIVRRPLLAAMALAVVQDLGNTAP